MHQSQQNTIITKLLIITVTIFYIPGEH